MTQVVFGSTKTLEASGASTASTNVVQADDATYGVVADGANYAHVDFVLVCAFATAPTENSTVDLILRPIDIDGTNDSEAPESGATTFKGNVVGGFVLNNVTTTQRVSLRVYDVPRLFEAWLYNGGGQTMSAAWTLTATPVGFKAVP